MNNRWKKAQKAEAAGKKIASTTPKSAEKVRRESLDLMCKFTSLSEEELKGMRILEIGGAVVERAFDSVNIPPKLVLDPLLLFPPPLGQQTKSCHRVRGVGEYLPLPDNSVDLCWCTNTIDHTFSPVTVVREIRRVLDTGGILVISCNVFPTWTKLFFPLFNAVDTPHPHHFTLEGFTTLVEREFDIQKRWVKKTVPHLSLAQNIKNNMAYLVGVRHVYFCCTWLFNGSRNGLESEQFAVDTVNEMMRRNYGVRE